jgi:hypothetical protein
MAVMRRTALQLLVAMLRTALQLLVAMLGSAMRQSAPHLPVAFL